MVVPLPKVKDEPFKEAVPVLLPKVRRLPAPVAILALPNEEREVKVPAAGVVVPMAVLFMPSAYVVKLAEVMSKLFVPRLILPEVAVKFKAPVV